MYPCTLRYCSKRAMRATSLPSALALNIQPFRLPFSLVSCVISFSIVFCVFSLLAGVGDIVGRHGVAGARWVCHPLQAGTHLSVVFGCF